MSGYNYFENMSNNAVAAYNCGEMPLSKWNKKNILSALKKAIENQIIDNKEEFIQNLKKEKLSDLKNLLLYKSSYHHTSKFYNTTYFYSFDDDFSKIIDSDKYAKYFKTQEKKSCLKSYLMQINKNYYDKNKSSFMSDFIGKSKEQKEQIKKVFIHNIEYLNNL